MEEQKFTKIEKFQCPEGFTVEEMTESQLKYEDIDEDCELWLVRLPPVLEPSNFEDSVISLDGNPNVLKHKGDNQRKYQCTAVPCETDDICLLLPRKKNNKLKVVKKSFTGSIFFTEEDLSPISTKSSAVIEDQDNSYLESVSDIDAGSLLRKKRHKKSSSIKGVTNKLSDHFNNDIDIKVEKPSETEDNLNSSHLSQISESGNEMFQKKKKRTKKSHKRRNTSVSSPD